jgi:hypothetical protein
MMASLLVDENSTVHKIPSLVMIQAVSMAESDFYRRGFV